MIFLGPGGTNGLGYEEAFKLLSLKKLNALEVEFTYGVRMTNETAQTVGELAKKHKIRLSVHGPYYINLVSKEKIKVAASKKRILDSCERGHYLGADYIVFHAGFYQGREMEQMYNDIKEQIIELNDTIKERKWRVTLAPELTGKGTQFGDIDELLRLVKETKCHLTVDFSHWKARTNGTVNYSEMMDFLSGIKHVHAHFSGIEYSNKGERRHVDTPDSEIMSLLSEAVKRKGSMTIINESPDPFRDSEKTRKTLLSLTE